WRDEVEKLERKLEVANAASDDARVEVLELAYKLYRLEKDAAAERERRDTAELALREELAHLREAADAGAAREVELEEEVTGLDSNVRWVTEVWGQKLSKLQEEKEVAISANDLAQAKVVEMTSKMQQLENDAIAERNRHDAAEVTLGQELTRLQLTADAAAKRCRDEQDHLTTE
ncbi:unnamed protein product, partial [Scytosiphon promiscuus]